VAQAVVVLVDTGQALLYLLLLELHIPLLLALVEEAALAVITMGQVALTQYFLLSLLQVAVVVDMLNQI
jgi:uncharacterized membrane protein